MMTIGEQLKNSREQRKLTLDQVSDETNIARRYLEALEAENFSVFPGEPYILGFLRNYADFLGLDAQSLINSFRGIQMQEQPVPLEQLLHGKRKLNKPLLAGLIAVAVVAAVTGIVWQSGVLARRKEPLVSVSREPVNHIMKELTFEDRLYPGDTVQVGFRGRDYLLKLNAISDRVALELPSGIMQYQLAEEGTIDFDRDNLPELRVFIRDFERNSAASGVLLRLSATDSLIADGSLAITAENASGESIILDPEAFTDTASATTARQVIFSGKRSPHPFILNVTFRNQAMFRHEIDRKEREERFYFRGDEITVTAINTAKIWASNAAATRLIIQASGSQSVEVELGSPGQIIVAQLRWTQAEDGTWSLSLFEVN